MFFKKLRDDIRTKCKFPILYVTILLFFVLLYVLDRTELDFKFKSIRFVHQIPTVKLDSNAGFVIKTSGCRIPFLDPFDKSILKFLYKPKPFKCSSKPPLIISNISSVYVNIDALPYYNITGEELKCCYLPFWRVDPQYNLSDDFFGYGHCIDFNLYAKIEEEFVKVVCTVNNISVYKDFHAFITEKRKGEVLTREKDLWLKNSGVEKLNVLIIGIDSISRLNFIRQMPKTLSFLKHQLHGIELIGYNKLGYNTFPNVIPILTGLSEDELSKVCWHKTDMKFDDCPFLWKNFSKAGYVTAYGEDSSWMGIFNYLKTGFQTQPTDYYWKTYNYLAEKEIGHNRMYNADLCMGARPTFIVLLEYIKKFVKSINNKPFFSFFWGNSLSHDNLNFPSIGDDIYKNFFNYLQKQNAFNQTVLIFLSDHGIRWGGIRSTHQGQLEERLPFLYFVFPTWFQNKYPTAVANLRRNTRRLTTPYDLHETLIDISDLRNILPNNIKLRSKNTTQRGISLFLHIPENRTCSTAGIANHWCTCQKSVKVNKTSISVMKAAGFIVDYINNLLVGYKACSKLYLSEILDARLLKFNDYDDVQDSAAIHDYTIIIKTNPGGALFEATVRAMYDTSINKTVITSKSFQLTGTISRINQYGDQSSCVTDFHLKLYCYCGG